LPDVSILSDVVGKIGGNAGGSRFHGFVAFLPVGRANLVSVGFNELQRRYHAESFINASAQREIVDYCMADDPFGVNEE
jgi:hypothetical protein